MTKYINADALMALPTIYVYNDEDENSEHNKAVLLDDVKGLPAADVVEVVRCKDCVWYSDEVEDVIGWCDRNDEHAVNAGGFCSHGERKQP